MYYQLVPELKNIENRQSVSDDFPEIRTADFFEYNNLEEIEQFIDKVLRLKQCYIFMSLCQNKNIPLSKALEN
ncbi:hypothetical protein [Heyndrickxia coagulans]|uniref:hypothetical protein n=1 Tax=Heyndrickxia coagulans TaxID=1398 RepID=UPI0022361169|nr:hypothetical protein [Heyndrickxia coagulans]UZH05435.1 hypothetical protein ONG97_10910 [Heyndrickxia coagulans]